MKIHYDLDTELLLEIDEEAGMIIGYSFGWNNDPFENPIENESGIFDE